jgi:hypothetical protein
VAPAAATARLRKKAKVVKWLQQITPAPMLIAAIKAHDIAAIKLRALIPNAEVG